MARRISVEPEQAASLLSQLLGNGHNAPVWLMLAKGAISAAGMVGTIMATLYVAVGGLQTSHDNLRKEFAAQTTRIDRLENSMKEAGDKQAKGIDDIKGELAKLVDTVHKSRPVVIKRVVPAPK